MNSQVNTYLTDGCGRCSLYRTPACKALVWQQELKQLRSLMLACGLQEEFKWSQPCYTFQNSNVVLVTAFKEYVALAFFKGALLQDTHQILTAPGKNSQAVRQARFTDVQRIQEAAPVLQAYIREAIALEEAGLKVNFKKEVEPILAELQAAFDKLPALQAAFEGLTPGRQRGYILHFSQPKQSKTRTARIEKHLERILQGKGLHDRQTE